MTSNRRKPFFERLRDGLDEGIAHAKGDMTLKTVVIPEKPPEIDAGTLAALRARAAMSQAVFARMLNVSPKTLQSWEQGLRQPSDASRRLIQIFCEHPEVVCRSAGLPEVTLKGVAIKHFAKGGRRIVVEPVRTRQARSVS